jgi:ATP-dependent RNA helicase DDX3X
LRYFADCSIGSGKTAAYLVPALSKLAGKIELMSFMRRKETGSRLAEPLILVVVPTRELAIQIHDDARRLCYRTMMRPCLAIGEVPLSLNFEELAKGCDILVGTPGRLVNLMNRPDALSMSRVK